MLHTILRLPTVLRARGISRSSHYNDVKQGLFTDPVQLGLRAVGWPDDEVAALNAARISGKTDAQIRELVETLHTKRKELMAAWGL
jgi:prophage regulatory protein